jgi:hypothetical protein
MVILFAHKVLRSAVAIAFAWLGASPAAAQQYFQYPPRVVAAAQQKADLKEREWRACFEQTLAANPRFSGVNWNFIAQIFKTCSKAENAYIKASLTAAQRRFPDPRTDQYGRIVAWDKLGYQPRSVRRAAWIDIRKDLEFKAMTFYGLQSRCERVMNNAYSVKSETCSVYDSGMYYADFDRMEPDR